MEFRKKYGPYNFLVMFFGLTNDLVAFMDLMNRVFRSDIDSYVIFFIDDIFVYLKNGGEHMDPLTFVLKVHKEHQLLAKHSKCVFLLRSVEFPCHIIFSEGFEVDPTKTKAVKNCPRPLTPTYNRIFLGLEGYY